MPGNDSIPPEPGRFSIQPLWIVLAMVLLFTGFLVFKVHEYLYETIPDRYAQAWVGGMVITHMRTHDGRWPHDWGDLKEAYEIDTERAGRPWSFEDLRDRVDVDFSADPMLLRKAGATFRVIKLRSGKRHHWEGSDPNYMIWRYLHENELLAKPDEPPARLSG